MVASVAPDQRSSTIRDDVATVTRLFINTVIKVHHEATQPGLPQPMRSDKSSWITGQNEKTC
ncbi:MAG: hypothetical protein MUF78_00275 [Candidatus Edwardsbacteria bacterium]|jgi:hypothetical protein|nr:hypothetical protein [Candidatus Edwardsbacteria bacterium]